MSYKVQKITEPLVLGEGPHWDERQQALLFIDIVEKAIHKYELSSGKHTKTKLDGGPGFIIPVEGTSDHFVVGVNRKFLVIQWDGKDESEVKVLRELGEVDQNEPQNKINDGKADPRGRLFAGTMFTGEGFDVFKHRKGSLYRIDTGMPGGTKIVPLADKIGISNGLAWDLKERAFYYTDSMEFKIRRYHYDLETGNISNPTFVYDLGSDSVNDGIPDGFTIDTDGNLWIAVFNRSCVIKVDPRTGKLLEEIPIPAKQVTSVTFGGPNLDILFVTTGSLNLGEEQLPPCGATFMVTGLGVKGHPNVNVRL